MEAIFEEIDAAFTSDPLIDEVGFIFEKPPSGGSVILTEHKLGIVATNLKPLYLYALAELKRAASVCSAGDSQLPLALAKELFSSSRIVLLIQANMALALNVRKRVLGDVVIDCDSSSATLCDNDSTLVNAIDAFETEVQLLDVLLLKSPKAPSLWQHRKWCLDHLLRLFDRKSHITVGAVSGDGSSQHSSGGYFYCNNNAALIREVALCEKLADLHAKNYFAWCHRCWLLRYMAHWRSAGEPVLHNEVLATESTRLMRWMMLHPSEACATNYLAHLLRLQIGQVVAGGMGLGLAGIPSSCAHSIRSGGDIFEGLSNYGCDEWQVRTMTVHSLLRRVILSSLHLALRRPGHQTLWYHRHACFALLVEHISVLAQKALELDSGDPCPAALSNRLKDMCGVDLAKLIASRYGGADIELEFGLGMHVGTTDEVPARDTNIPSIDCCQWPSPAEFEEYGRGKGSYRAEKGLHPRGTYMYYADAAFECLDSLAVCLQDRGECQRPFLRSQCGALLLLVVVNLFASEIILVDHCHYSAPGVYTSGTVVTADEGVFCSVISNPSNATGAAASAAASSRGQRCISACPPKCACWVPDLAPRWFVPVGKDKEQPLGGASSANPQDVKTFSGSRNAVGKDDIWFEMNEPQSKLSKEYLCRHVCHTFVMPLLAILSGFGSSSDADCGLTLPVAVASDLAVVVLQQLQYDSSYQYR